jgi:hypothetical protein
MRWTSAVALLIFAVGVSAKEHDYQKGTLLQMTSIKCGSAENGGHSVAGEILGTDGEHKKMQDLLCQEYVLQTDRVVYHIRPKDDKHPVLLPVGEAAEFRMDKDKMVLRVPEGDGKEHDYLVVSMTPRTDAQGSQSAAAKQ